MDQTKEVVTAFATRVKNFWKVLGYDIKVEVVPVVLVENGDETKRRTNYTIRSNLINGLPYGFGKNKDDMVRLESILSDYFI